MLKFVLTLSLICLTMSKVFAFGPPYVVKERFPYPYDHSLEPIGHNPKLVSNQEILILTTTELMDHALRYQAIKRNHGLSSRIITLHHFDNNTQVIKSIIAQEFSIAPFTYLTIIGDEKSVKPAVGTRYNVYEKESDPVYTLVDDDIYPDFVIGRIPFSDDLRLESYLDKLDSFKAKDRPRLLGVGSNEGDKLYYRKLSTGAYESYYGKKDYVHVQNFMEHLDEIRDEFTYSILKGPSLSKEAVIQEINTDIDMLLYIGHGKYNSIRTSGFGNDDVSKLTNRTPFIFFSVACNVGEFVNKESLSERLLEQNTNSKGAIVAIAGSTVQDWLAPLRVLNNFKDGIESPYETIGLRFTNAMIENLKIKNDRNLETFENWHILGDPALPDLFTKKVN